MPAGELLANEIAKLLTTHTAKTVGDLHAELTGAVSRRAVRYAVQMLVTDGRAKLLGPKAKGVQAKHNRQRYKVVAVSEKEAQAREAAYREQFERA